MRPELPPARIEQLSDDVTLHVGDCREVLPTLGRVDAVVTDPPYGLEDWNTRGINACKGKGRAWGGLGRNGGPAFDGDQCAQWDKAPDGKLVASLMAAGEHKIIWGANYLLDHLPRTKQLFIWNKGVRGMHYNDCEVAWTFDYSPASAEAKEHPTQKPLALMRWCISRLPANARSILDPFMGSGTTGVACVQLGRRFIGIELEPRYFDIACKRIGDELKQPRLDLGEPAPKPMQETML